MPVLNHIEFCKQQNYFLHFSIGAFLNIQSFLCSLSGRYRNAVYMHFILFRLYKRGQAIEISILVSLAFMFVFNICSTCQSPAYKHECTSTLLNEWFGLGYCHGMSIFICFLPTWYNTHSPHRGNTNPAIVWQLTVTIKRP